MLEVKDLHKPFEVWLKKEHIPYIHSRTDKKHTNVVGDCDFYCLYVGRVLGIEFKLPTNKLSEAQIARILSLRSAGNQVEVCFTLQEAVEAVQKWLGVIVPESKESALQQARGGLPWQSEKNVEPWCEECGCGINEAHKSTCENWRKRPEGAAKEPGAEIVEMPPQNTEPREYTSSQWIAEFRGAPCVFMGTGEPGTMATLLRRATENDKIILPRRYEMIQNQ